MGIMKIHLINVDKQTREALMFFFQKIHSGRCVLVNESEADVFILNMDHYQAQQHYQRVTLQYPDSTIITLAIKPIDLDNSHFLQKPIAVDKLSDILENITLLKVIDATEKNKDDKKNVAKENKPQETAGVAQRLNKKQRQFFIGNVNEVDLSDRQQLKKVQFDLKRYALGYICEAYQLAIQQNDVVRLSGLLRTMTFFPETDQAYIDLTDSQLRAICMAPIVNHSGSKNISIKESHVEWVLPLCGNKKSYRSMDGLLWKLALISSRGRLPDFVDINAPIIIRGWPNLTRLDVSPHAMKLIAFWLSNSVTIVDTIARLNIEQRHVFSLYTALHVLGYIVTEKQEINYVDEKMGKISSKTRNVLGKVLASLKLA
jgi:hypothetical protein